MFEDQLIESKRQKVDRKRLMTLPMSVLIHVVVVSVAVVATMWAVDEIPEPPIPVSFYAAPPPPPPPPAPPKAAPKAPPKVEAPKEVVAPVVIPTDLPPPTDSDATGEGVEGGVEGGVPGGVLGGVLGGVPHAPEVTPTPVPEPTAPLRVGGEIKEPKVIDQIQPQYPEAARRARIQGPVILELIVDKQGKVRDVRVLRGLPLGCTESAVEAVRRWKYSPSLLNGRPVEVYVILTVHFRMSN
jgi:protein TonB